MKDIWYKNAIIYSLDVETFMDSDGDGVGDFVGLCKHLDYLTSLGVNCLWLLPFYPSSNRDNGYDVTDYYNVDSRLGNLGDFVEFMHMTRERGIRVIIDLVVNHTSNQHPWFQFARSDKNSKYHNYYVWSDDPDRHPQAEPVFPDREHSIWEYDEKAGAYYLHHFYKEQPDLNISNPAVQEEIWKIMGFWLELGVSGFRVDAAPFLIESIGMEKPNRENLQNVLSQMRDFIIERTKDGVLLAEANVAPENIPIYFGNGDRMQMLFGFLLNQYLFLALAEEKADYLKKGFNILPDIPPGAQWVNFLRHHDELTLDKLSEDDREKVFAAFAPDEEMRIYGRGIRRRLSSMLKGDRRRLELAYSLLFSLPGTPLLRYGDEIGMGDDLSLEGRTSVRTPMQWSNINNGGFSKASPEKLVRLVISGGEYGYQQVNVGMQQRDPHSLLNWMERVIRIRKQCPEFGNGEWRILETDRSQVFAHCCRWQDDIAIAIHNLSAQPCTVTLKTDEYDTKYLMDLLGDRQYQPISNCHSIPIEGYGYRWFRADGLA